MNIKVVAVFDVRPGQSKPTTPLKSRRTIVTNTTTTTTTTNTTNNGTVNGTVNNIDNNRHEHYHYHYTTTTNNNNIDNGTTNNKRKRKRTFSSSLLILAASLGNLAMTSVSRTRALTSLPELVRSLRADFTTPTYLDRTHSFSADTKRQKHK